MEIHVTKQDIRVGSLVHSLNLIATVLHIDATPIHPTNHGLTLNASKHAIIAA